MPNIETYEYRGRYNGGSGKMACGPWIYFMATGDQDAKVEFRRISGLTAGESQVQTYDEGFKFWMDIEW